MGGFFAKFFLSSVVLYLGTKFSIYYLNCMANAMHFELLYFKYFSDVTQFVSLMLRSVDLFQRVWILKFLCFAQYVYSCIERNVKICHSLKFGTRGGSL